jgi:hypothetical protein
VLWNIEKGLALTADDLARAQASPNFVRIPKDYAPSP